MELPLLEYTAMEKLRSKLPPQASVHNPLDVLGDADEVRYSLALDAAAESANIDAIIVVLTPQAMTPDARIAQVVAEAAAKCPSKPMLAAFMGLADASAAIQTLRRNNIPNYHFPEQAAMALGSMVEYGEIAKRRPERIPADSSADEKKAQSIIDAVRRQGRRNLTIEESLALAHAYGMPIPKARVATSKDEAARTADEIGYPVVMKIVSPEIVHKTDLGGVVLNVGSRDEVEENYDRMLQKMRLAMPQATIRGVLVQRMYPAGKEVIVGAVRDPQFGPLIMFGLGGIYVNFLRDVSYGLAPLTETEARQMIQGTKAYALLSGVRGQAPSDVESIVQVMIQLSRIMIRFEEIVEMEINPLFAYERGCLAVDVRATVAGDREIGGEP